MANHIEQTIFMKIEVDEMWTVTIYETPGKPGYHMTLYDTYKLDRTRFLDSFDAKTLEEALTVVHRYINSIAGYPEDEEEYPICEWMHDEES